MTATEGRQLKPCGTWAAASRHERRGEPLDKACREARRQRSNAASRRYRARYGTGYVLAYQKAERRAARLVRERWPDEWRQILTEETAGYHAADVAARRGAS